MTFPTAAPCAAARHPAIETPRPATTGEAAHSARLGGSKPGGFRAPAWPRTVVRDGGPDGRGAAWDALVTQVAHGDVAAFEALHRLARPFALRVARQAIGQSALAEEIAQDAFVKVWLHADRFDPREAPAITWLATIVRNRARDVARHLKGERTRVVAASAAIVEALPDESDGPAAIAERRERVPALGVAVAALPERDREVLALAYCDGLAHSEIATALGAPLGTVKTRLRRAHEKLARALAPAVGAALAQ
jgi:RNA polymerase sigma-70 factor (ECF subfamily)